MEFWLLSAREIAPRTSPTISSSIFLSRLEQSHCVVAPHSAPVGLQHSRMKTSLWDHGRLCHGLVQYARLLIYWVALTFTRPMD